MEQFIIYLIVGLIFPIAGIFLLLFPPKNINGMYGYRSTLSMSDQRYWDFAQKYSAKLLIVGGLLILVIGLLVYCSPISISNGLSIGIALGTILIVSFFLIYLTEKAIKKQFDLE